jgi:holo-[acyl-carrier protein] synthase
LKISCGTDIIEIDRIKKSIDRQGNKFIETIFTKKEIEYCENHKENKYQHYAARFAVKEAIYKALSGIVEEDKLTWKNFEIINCEHGKPKIEINDEKIESMDVSISHCREYAVANVVVLYK